MMIDVYSPEDGATEATKTNILSHVPKHKQQHFDAAIGLLTVSLPYWTVQPASILLLCTDYVRYFVMLSSFSFTRTSLCLEFHAVPFLRSLSALICGLLSRASIVITDASGWRARRHA